MTDHDPYAIDVTAAADPYQHDTKTVDLIVAFADASNLDPRTQISLCIGESDMDLYAVRIVNDAGDINGEPTQPERSYGGYQINLNAHVGDASTYVGYDGLVRSMHEMLGAWRAAFEACGSWDACQHDRYAFLVEYWPRAQGAVRLRTQAQFDRAKRCVQLADVYYIRHLKRQQTAPTPDPKPPTGYVLVKRDDLTALQGGITLEAQHINMLSGWINKYVS